MTITVDLAVEAIRTGTGSPTTVTTTGAAASGIKGVIVGLMHGTSTTDHISAVTYAGTAMTRISRYISTTSAGEPGAAELWFLGSGVTQGAQDCVYTSGATTDDIHCVVITLLAATDLQVASIGGVGTNANSANPSAALTYGARTGMAFAAGYSGVTAQTSVTAGASCSKVGTAELTGNFCSYFVRQTTGGTSNFTIAATIASDDVAFAAAAIVEAGPIVPGLGASTATGLAPSSIEPRTVLPGVGAATASGSAPTVLSTHRDEPGAAALAYYGAGPTVKVELGTNVGAGVPGLTLLFGANIAWSNVAIEGTTGAATATGQAPAQLVNHITAPGLGTATAAGLAPTQTVSATVLPGAAAAVVSGLAPTAIQAHLALPGVGSLVAASEVVTVVETAPGITTFVPDTGAATLSGLAPAGVVAYLVQPGLGGATVTGLAPARLVNHVATPGAGALTASGAAPDAVLPTSDVGVGAPGLLWLFGSNLSLANYGFMPGTGSLAATGYVPPWGNTFSFEIPAGALTASSVGPYVSAEGQDQHPTIEAAGALTATGHAPGAYVGVQVVFPFLTTAQGFVGTPGTATTMAWTGAAGNPAGALSTRTTGRNRSSTSTWALATDWAALGIPANCVITAISAASSQSRCSEFASGSLTPGVISALTLVPTGYSSIVLSAARTYSAIEPGWTPTAGTTQSGLQIASGSSLSIRGTTTIYTLNSGSPAVTVLRDNITFVVTYTAAKVLEPGLGSATVTGLAPTVVATAAAQTFPGTGAIAASGSGPNVLVNTPVATDGGGGPGIGLLFGLNLAEPPVEGVEFPVNGELVATGHAPSISRPITVAGEDFWDSGLATITNTGGRVITLSSPQIPVPSRVLTATGQQPTIVARADHWFYPDTGQLTYDWQEFLSGISYLFEPGTATLTYQGQVVTLEGAPIAEPFSGTAAITGYAPELQWSGSVIPDAGLLTLTGEAPTLAVQVWAFPGTGALVATGYGYNAVGWKTWAGDGALQAQVASTTGSGFVTHHASGALQSGQPLSFVGTATRRITGSGTWRSGPASLAGAVYILDGWWQSGEATLIARTRITAFVPNTRRMIPQRVNRYTVALKPSPRYRTRRPNTRIPPK